jgi:ribA/ribD-fused uncharacterized protein
MKTALLAKFMQNQQPAKVLLESRTQTIVEASLDKYWGCGKRLNDPLALEPTTWKDAKNTMGKLLDTVRRELSE